MPLVDSSPAPAPDPTRAAPSAKLSAPRPTNRLLMFANPLLSSSSAADLAEEGQTRATSGPSNFSPSASQLARRPNLKCATCCFVSLSKLSLSLSLCFARQEMSKPLVECSRSHLLLLLLLLESNSSNSSDLSWRSIRALDPSAGPRARGNRFRPGYDSICSLAPS